MKQFSTAMIFSLVFAFSAHAQQKTEIAYLYSPKDMIHTSVANMLAQLAGKSVILYLSNGTEVRGSLSTEKIGTASTVYLTSLAEKDYYGALIDLKQIVGVSFYNKK